jgi:hypothetical protein
MSTLNVDKNSIQRRIDDALARIGAQLVWVGDTLIPHDDEGGLPSASEAQVPTLLMPRALRAREDLIEPFVTILERLPATVPERPMEALRALGDGDFETVSHLVAGAYFLDAEINRKLRYPGQESMDYAPDYDEIMDVVQRVIDRGPIYIDPETGERAKAA